MLKSISPSAIAKHGSVVEVAVSASETTLPLEAFPGGCPHALADLLSQEDWPG